MLFIGYCIQSGQKIKKTVQNIIEGSDDGKLESDWEIEDENTTKPFTTFL